MTEQRQTQRQILARVSLERDRQNRKWGTDFAGRMDQEWLEILLEEIGEALTEPAASLEREGELIQVAAVAASWAQHCASEVEHPNTNDLWEPRINYAATSITKVMRDIGAAAQRRLDARYAKCTPMPMAKDDGARTGYHLPHGHG